MLIKNNMGDCRNDCDYNTNEFTLTNKLLFVLFDKICKFVVF